MWPGRRRDPPVTTTAAGGPVPRPVPFEELGRPTWDKLVRWDEVGALVRYRVMAFVVGVGLLLLVGIGMPLQFLAHQKVVVQVVGTLHGYLYLLYLVTAADLARRAHWRIGRILAVVAAGFVPFLAFVVEHRVYRQMRAEYADAQAETRPPGEAQGEAQVEGDGVLPAGSAD
jgi:integral membrane protein